MKHQIFRRSQHSNGSAAHQFGGPDTYVAVVSRKDGVEPWPQNRHLNQKHLAARGYEITYCGEGYSDHCGPRSMLGRAIAEAERLAGSAS